MNKKIVLLVEDNPDDVDLTLRAFKKNNIANDVMVVDDGPEALDFLFCEGEFADRDPTDVPQVVLLDLKLPRLNGLEVLRRIREDARTCLLPVVILTSSKQEDDVANGYRLGCNSYLRKPVDFVAFNEAIKELGLYWLVLNEPPPTCA
ncbi:MAG: response regulator [Actinobacteria bacterium]|nr:response regulator [Actinomycetota bacterium]